MRSPRQRRRTARAAQVLAPLAVAIFAGQACGQGDADKAEPEQGAMRIAQPAPPPRAEPYEITGRTFAGVKWPLAPAEGRIEISGQRAHAWTDSEGVGGRFSEARRIAVDGDVRITLGTYAFTARRAAVWIAPLPPGDPDAAPDVWQVFAVLDEPNAAEQVAPIALVGGRLPVRGIIRAKEGVELRADRLVQGRPQDPFVGQAERILADRLRRIVAPQLAPLPAADLARAPELIPGLTPGPPTEEETVATKREAAEFARRLPAPAAEAPIFAKDGIISFSAGEITAVKDEGNPAVILARSVTISYWDKRHDKTLQIAGERAVVFLEQGASPTDTAEAKSSAAGKVRGFYLEGDVTFTDGEHTGRSPRVYFSVRDNRATLIDAVFWTYDQRRQMPLYVRAKAIEMLSMEQFRATSASLSNSAFFEPDLSIGASTVTVTRREEEGQQRVLVDARDITLRAGGLPFFYWPVLKGDPSSIPLREFRIDNSTGSGVSVKSTWNLYSLLGVQAKKDDSAELILDGYFERGMAFGGSLHWGEDQGPSRGGLFAYGLPEDHGTDILPTGQRISHEGEARSMILGEHRADLTDEWTLFAEGSYISDPNFVPGFYEHLARNRREFTNSLYLRRTDDNAVLSGEVRAREGDFIANEYLLQSPGYSVAKYPDIGYWRLADDLLDEHPGLLTYSSSYRFTEMRMQFVDPKVQEFGFKNPFRSESAFGLMPGESIADALRARGLTQEPIARVDTRHELSMQLAAGPLSITPFVVGRLTAYDDTFEKYSPEADEYYRAWGAAGVTVSTEISRIDNSVESRIFDLHRVRHIVRPEITVWHADTTIDRTALPVFDDEVESLAEGTAARFGIDQTWQTQRGGPGRWRSVDVFRLNAGVVTSSGDVDKESPIGRWFEYQPELSNLGGTFGTLQGAWQATEALGFAGESVYDFDIGQQARSVIGFNLQHDTTFATFGEVRYINSQNQTYAIVGAHYDLTPKYGVGGTASYDMVRGEFQSFGLDIRRKFPNVILGTSLSYNNITGVTSFGMIFQPVGVNSGPAQIRGLGGSGSGGLAFQ